MSEALRFTIAAACVLGWLVLVAVMWRRYRGSAARTTEPGAIIVAYASQTGTAGALARKTAEDLERSGQAVSLCSFATLSPRELAGADRALFVAATTGDGDPPDDARAFFAQWRKKPQSLDGVHYALLALGDSNYPTFCGFGRDFDHFLRDAGAMPTADMVEVDQGSPTALRHWQQNLRLFGASASLPDWTPPRYTRWQLAGRELLNAGSPGEPIYALRLECAEALPPWWAGDIAEVYPGPADDGLSDAPPLSHRDYSIATLPDEGALGLTVRMYRDQDGRPGLGSRWLCEDASIGGEIALRVRRNPRFHPPQGNSPLVLIGNGTGIASLRAHLKARPAGSRNWLVYGERDPLADRPFDEELTGWAQSGHIERLDRIFSRDGSDPRYVQHAIAAEADLLKQWIDAGAVMLVCGSVAMGNDVDQTLREVLSVSRLDELAARGRYRRDIY